MRFFLRYFTLISILVLLLCADMWSFFLIESDSFHFLFSFLIVQIVYFRSTFCLWVALFFIGIASWVMYGTGLLSLSYALPIALFLYIFQSYFYQSRPTLLLLSSTSSLVTLTIQNIALGTPLSVPYAVGTICANMGIISLFYLKAIQGKMRQSLIRL